MRKILLLIAFSFLLLPKGHCADSLFHKGVAALVHNDYSKAKALFSSLAKQSPSYSAYYNLGVAYGKLQQWNEAKWAFESALKYAPTNADAQANAAFATHKINKNKVWKHPYSWVTRIFIRFGYGLWLTIIIISSLFLGYLIYLFIVRPSIAKGKINKQLGSIALVLFILSFFGIITINRHFSQPKYVILKPSQAEFYLSPNGVSLSPTIDWSERFVILPSENKEWLHITSANNKQFWVKRKNVLIY